jgi:hypothetical protein
MATGKRRSNKKRSGYQKPSDRRKALELQLENDPGMESIFKDVFSTTHREFQNYWNGVETQVNLGIF